MVSFDHKILHGDMVARSRMIIDTQRAGAQQPAGGAGEDRRDGWSHTDVTGWCGGQDFETTESTG